MYGLGMTFLGAIRKFFDDIEDSWITWLLLSVLCASGAWFFLYVSVLDMLDNFTDGMSGWQYNERWGDHYIGGLGLVFGVLFLAGAIRLWYLLVLRICNYLKRRKYPNS